jgi:hypothetical protein
VKRSDVGNGANWELNKSVDPLGDVISWNLHRRQLNTGQKAFVVSKLATMTRSDAGLIGASVTNKTATPNLELPKMTVKEASKLMGISPASVFDARMIERESPELARDIESGKTTINKAKEQIKAKAQEKRLDHLLPSYYRAVFALHGRIGRP